MDGERSGGGVCALHRRGTAPTVPGRGAQVPRQSAQWGRPGTTPSLTCEDAASQGNTVGRTGDARRCAEGATRRRGAGVLAGRRGAVRGGAGRKEKGPPGRCR